MPIYNPNSAKLINIPLNGIADNANRVMVWDVNANIIQIVNTLDNSVYAQLDGNSYQPPYKIYTALLTQTGTNPPVANVLENTLGGILVWTRNDVGNYYATLANAFPEENKFFSPNSATETYATNVKITNYWDNTDAFQLNTFIGNGVSIPYSPQDDILFNYPIEIRVYN